jgi:hypothetical protein
MEFLVISVTEPRIEKGVTKIEKREFSHRPTQKDTDILIKPPVGGKNPISQKGSERFVSTPELT